MQKFNDENETLNPKAENELSIETLSIFKNATSKTVQKFKPLVKSTSGSKLSTANQHTRHTRNNSNSNISKAVGLLPSILSQASIRSKSTDLDKNTISNFQNSTLSLINKSFTVKDTSFSIEFKELQPENVLEKLGSSLYKFSLGQINNKQKENYELKRFLNKLIENTRLNKLKLLGIKNQLEKSEDNLREQCEIKTKVDDLQLQMELYLDKLNKSEAECRRLECILSCCFKNPARNDEWARGLEKGIENMKAMIKFELNEIKNASKETEILEEQFHVLSETKKDKVIYQHDTIERIISQFDIKDRINETLSEGQRKRKALVTRLMSAHNNHYYFDKIKARNKLKLTISEKSQYLREKVDHYNSIMMRIAKVTNIHHPREMVNVLWTLEKNRELQESVKIKQQKINECKCERDLLFSKLQIFKKRDLEQEKQQNIVLSLDELQDKVLVSEQQLERLHMLSKKQENLYISCLGSIEQL